MRLTPPLSTGKLPVAATGRIGLSLRHRLHPARRRRRRDLQLHGSDGNAAGRYRRARRRAHVVEQPRRRCQYAPSPASSDLTEVAAGTPVTLTLDAVEYRGDHDYGYVMASADGEHWQILAGQRTLHGRPLRATRWARVTPAPAATAKRRPGSAKCTIWASSPAARSGCNSTTSLTMRSTPRAGLWTTWRSRRSAGGQLRGRRRGLAERRLGAHRQHAAAALARAGAHL